MTAPDPLAAALAAAVKDTNLGAVTVDEFADRLAAAARSTGIRVVSAEPIDDPVASVTLTGVTPWDPGAALRDDMLPETEHEAAGNGYSDDQRTAALLEVAAIADRLRDAADRLAPHTEHIMAAERLLAAVEAEVFAYPDADHG